MRISDWSSDVCSSDLNDILRSSWCEAGVRLGRQMRLVASVQNPAPSSRVSERDPLPPEDRTPVRSDPPRTSLEALYRARSEEHTSELQSLMRISYAVFCLKKKKNEHLIKSTVFANITQSLYTLRSQRN